MLQGRNAVLKAACFPAVVASLKTARNNRSFPVKFGRIGDLCFRTNLVKFYCDPSIITKVIN